MRAYPVLLGLALVLAPACAKKTPEPGENTSGTTTSTMSESRPVQDEESIAREKDDEGDRTEAAVAKVKANLERVYFGFNEATLSSESRAALEDNARIMKEHPNITVEIEGHTDERGTEEYNLALGQRRAEAVADYLVRLGVPESHVKTRSLGEAKPLADGEGETVWGQNRRAEFRVTAGDMMVSGTVDEDEEGT